MKGEVNNVGSQAGSETQLSRLADEFIAQCGQQPSLTIDEYAARHPELADVIRRVFPVLRMLEHGPSDDNEMPSAFSDLESGFRLGDFRIVREVGHGGMGIVYEAEQISLGRRVALKVLPYARLLSDRQLQRFKNEARAAALLQHPNIVTIHSVGFDRGTHFFAMEFIDGESLASVIAGRAAAALPTADAEPSAIEIVQQLRRNGPSGGRVPTSRWRTVARIGVQVAEALEHAHSQGVLHRDVKPANILIDRNGRICVTDFGLARIQTDDGLTATGDIVGTLRYMSPEQICGDRSIDGRSDIYSLGVTLYELSVGQPAFDHSSRELLLLDILHKPPIRPSRLLPAIPRDLETVILKAMSKEPRDRYRSARELRLDLERFIDGRPVAARRASTWNRFKSWCWRRPAVAALSASLILIIALLAIAGPLVAWRQAQLTNDVRHSLLHSDLNLAYQAWYSGNAGRAEEFMARHPQEATNPALRFAQTYLRTKLQQAERQILCRHEGGVYDIAVSPDGTIVASAGADGAISLVEIATGRLVKRWSSGIKSVAAVAFNPDGSRLITAGAGGHLVAWDWRTAQPQLRYMAPPGKVNRVVFAPDGDAFAASTESGWIGLCSGEGERRWTIQAHDTDVWGMAFSPDGSTIATSCEYDPAIKLWNSATGELKRIGANVPHLAFGVDFMPTDGTLVTISPIGAQFWNPETGIEQMRLSYSTMPIAALAVSKHQLLATGGWDHQIMVWDYPTRWRLGIYLGNRQGVTSLAFTPDGNWLLSGSDDGTVRRFDLKDARAIQQSLSHLDLNREANVRLSNDGSTLYSLVANWGAPLFRRQDGVLTRWNVNSRQSLQSVMVDSALGASMCVSPDARIIALAGEGGVSLRNASDLSPMRTLDTAPAYSIAMSPDGRWLAALGNGQERVAGGTLGQLRIWQLPNGVTPVLDVDVGNTARRTALICFSADSKSLVLGTHSEAGSVCWKWQWNGQAWNERVRFVLTAPELPNTVICVPDTDDVVLTMHGGILMRLDLAARRIRWMARGTSQGIFSATLVPDRKLLVAGSDRAIQFWDAESGTHLATTYAAMWVSSLSVSPDSRLLVWGGGDGTVNFEPTEFHE